MRLYSTATLNRFLQWFSICLCVLILGGGGVIKDILSTACYSGRLFSKARLEKTKLIPIGNFVFIIFKFAFLNTQFRFLQVFVFL